MKVRYAPQLSGEKKPEYAFKGEKVGVKAEAETFVFDLSGCEEGQFLQEAQEVGGRLALVSARRENGELLVELWNPIGVDAGESERFPEEFVPEEGTLPKGKTVKPAFVSPEKPGKTLEEKVAVLEEELLLSYEAQAELFEQTLVMQEENLIALEAVATLYEMMS